MQTHLHVAAWASLGLLSLVTSNAALPAQNWTQLTPSGSATGRFYHTLAFDSGRNRAVMFGGLNGTAVTNDTWEWAPGTNTWTQLNPVARPSPRQVMAYAYDVGRGRTVVWGGFDGTFLSDTWEWDGTNWIQASTSTPFPGRCAATMVYDTQRERCILFGGQGSSTFANDVWEWNGSAWTQTFAGTTGSSAPAPRFHHNAVYDSRLGRVVVFGGANGTTTFGDTWAWSPSTSTWTQVSTSGPSARSQVGMIYDPRIDKTLLFGGETQAGAALGETWALEGNAWTLLTTANPPAARRRHVMAFRPDVGKSLLFGGQQTGNVLAETWELDSSSNAVTAPISTAKIATTGGPVGLRDHALAPLPTGGLLLFGGNTASGPQPLAYTFSGTTFQAEYPKFSPVFRSEHSLMFDPARQNNVMFGGKDPVGRALSATWIWANSQWNSVATTTGPSARSGHRMSFDSSANVGLLFGGENSTGVALSDFWSWNGTNWTQLTPSLLPPARARHGMAFSQRRNRTVVYGGRNGTTRLSDVWEWNGTAWNEALPGSQPFERHGHGMVYDSSRSRTVLFGGRNNSGFSTETWELTNSAGPISPGVAWNRRSPQANPTQRNSFGMAYDSARGRTVLFGGFDSTNYFNDTWTFNGTNWIQSFPTVAPPSRSAHGMTFDSARGRAVMFGGFSTSGDNSTWEWNGFNWASVTTAATPSPRRFAPLAYDSVRQRVVMFGGLSPTNALLSDTWEYNGVNWTQITATGPSARMGVHLTFDPVRNETVLFGGSTTTGVDNQTWTWNGTTWTQKNPAQTPPARLQGDVAFDSGRGRVVLFGGGTTNWASNFSDTWEWNGTNWSAAQLLPANSRWSPGARDGHAMAYDPRSERIVSYGGTTASGAKQDIWSWNGIEWSQHFVQSGPSPTAGTGAQLVHDHSGNRLLLHGGGDNASFSNEMWDLRLPVFAEVTSYGAPCVGTRGTLSLNPVGGSLPIVGTTFQMEFNNVPVFAPTLGWLGFSNTLINGVPLPLPLDSYRMFGCFAYMSGERNWLLAAANNTTGVGAWNLTIPLDPVFISVRVYLQGLALEFGATRGGTTTNALDVKIGNQ